jgi:DNA-binding response OmpR family regulator
MRLLVAEDDAGVRSVLQRGLVENGYLVDVAKQGDDALHLLRVNEYAAVILDWRMPGMSGEEVARSARRLKIQTPILMLTARDTVADRVAGLDAGADDYLVKPFSFEELLARLRALLRRPADVAGPVLTVSGVTLDPARRLVTVAGHPTPIAGVEYAMLELLMRRSPSVVERSTLANHAWPEAGTEISSNAMEVHVANLRRRLHGGSVKLVAVRGTGYRLTGEEA